MIVTLAPQDAVVSIAGDAVDLRSSTGFHTGVTGQVTATMTVPAGWTLDKDTPVTIVAPLSKLPFKATRATLAGGKLTASFNKGDLDNNIVAGDGQPLVVSANFFQGSVQKKLQGTAKVKVVK